MHRRAQPEYMRRQGYRSIKAVYGFVVDSYSNGHDFVPIAEVLALQKVLKAKSTKGTKKAGLLYISFPRAPWERSAGRAASRMRQTLVVIRGAARLDCIPTRRVGPRTQDEHSAFFRGFRAFRGQCFY